MGPHKLLAVLALTLSGAAASCSSVEERFGDDPVYRKAHAVTVKAADATVTATSKAAEVSSVAVSKAYKRYQKYLAEQDLLKTFHDAGEHSEGAVLGILRKSGIAKSHQPGSAKPPKGAAPPPPLAHVPEQMNGQMRWPVDAFIVSSGFGTRWGKPHKGLDLAAETGEPVHASAAGEVIYAGSGLHGYGNVVILRHDRQMSSLYAHNSELRVKQGDQVAQGALIALLGSTGHSTGPHVHFEIREGENAVDPAILLPKPQFAGTMDRDRDVRMVSAPIPSGSLAIR